MKRFFQPSLNCAKEVLENQLELAESNRRQVDMVILTGGFGQSPSLQSHLRTYLAELPNSHRKKIDLIVPPSPSVVPTPEYASWEGRLTNQQIDCSG
jgi:actin-related protein